MTRLAYLDVPKTAGTSFVRVLRRQFSAANRAYRQLGRLGTRLARTRLRALLSEQRA